MQTEQTTPLLFRASSSHGRRGRKVPDVPYCAKATGWTFHGVGKVAREIGRSPNAVSSFLSGRIVSERLWREIRAKFPKIIPPEVDAEYRRRAAARPDRRAETAESAAARTSTAAYTRT